MPYREKRTISGNLMEVDIRFVTEGGRATPGTRREQRDETQEKRNDRKAELRLGRLIRQNFEGGVHVTLTHEDDPDEDEAAQRAAKFLDLMRKWCKDKGCELKYIRVDEKQGKWHTHLILQEVPPVAELKAMWGHGRVDISTLDASEHYANLAKYLVDQEKEAKGKCGEIIKKQKRRKGQRRWSCSRNLKQPEVEEIRDIKRPKLGAIPKPPRGYRLLNDWAVGCDWAGNIWQAYTCVKVEKPVDPRRQAKGRKGARA